MVNKIHKGKKKAILAFLLLSIGAGKWGILLRKMEEDGVKVLKE